MNKKKCIKCLILFIVFYFLGVITDVLLEIMRGL